MAAVPRRLVGRVPGDLRDPRHPLRRSATARALSSRDADGSSSELRAQGLLVESEGAQVVELPDEKTPILLITKDGTTLYATRDVAAAEYRERTYHPTRSLYVVDRGQALHFRQLFKLLAKMGYDVGERAASTCRTGSSASAARSRHAPAATSC